jgi:hypothetical protein
MSLRNMALMACILSLFILTPSSHATQHSIYSGFAEPESLFTLNSRDFGFADETDTRSITLNANDDAVYRYAYISHDGQPWEQFDLTGTALGGYWLTGSVRPALIRSLRLQPRPVEALDKKELHSHLQLLEDSECMGLPRWLADMAVQCEPSVCPRWL